MGWASFKTIALVNFFSSYLQTSSRVLLAERDIESCIPQLHHLFVLSDLRLSRGCYFISRTTAHHCNLFLAIEFVSLTFFMILQL